MKTLSLTLSKDVPTRCTIYSHRTGPWYRAGESWTQIRGIKEIANSHQVLDKSFWNAAEFGNMIKDFCETLGINDNQNTKRDDYYQLEGSKNTRIGDNVEKLSAIFNTYNVNFNH